MQCSRCGAPVQPGMAFCPNCGQPYAAAQNAPIPPTQYAGPSSADQQAAQQYAPPANPYAPQSPASYETPGGYGTPPPPDPYGQQSSYGTPPPPSVYNNAQSPYGTPPPPPNYGTPYAPAPGAFVPQGQPPRKKGPNVGLIIGIVVLLILLIGGGVLALKGLNHSGGQTNTNTPTTGTTSTTGTTVTPGVTNTTTTNNQASPSGSPIDPGAAAIITNIQSASGIDASLFPTNPTTQFKAGDTVYVTYRLHLTQSGYVEAKVYVDGAYATETSLAVQVGKYDHGYFKITYKQASQGAFELYWCLQSNCSDEQLAGVASFTVS